jgi:hypothetical protein
MPNLYAGCRLDDKAVAILTEWKKELQGFEATARSNLDALNVELAKLEASAKANAAATFTTDGGNETCTLTWKEAGAGGNEWRIYLRLSTDFSGPSHTIDTNAKLITFDLAVDVPPSTSATDPDELKAYVESQPDLDELLSVTADPPVSSEPLTVNVTKQLEGGHSASLTTLDSLLGNLFGKRGVTYREMLERIGVPSAEVGQSPSTVLSEVAPLVFLSSGKTFKQTGTNLVNLRALWLLIAQNTSQLNSLLTQSFALVWTRTTTTTLSAEQCQRAEPQTVTSVELLGVNVKKPATDAEQNVWWMGEVDNGFSSLSLLQAWEADIQTAVNESASSTHVIEDPGLFTDNELSNSDIEELLGTFSSVLGVDPISFADALREVTETPVSAATGYISPVSNVPPSLIKDELSPPTTFAQQIAESPCIDPVAMSGLSSLLAAADAAISSVTFMLEAALSPIQRVLNKAASIVAALRNFATDVAQDAGCFGGWDISFDGPTFDVISLELPFFSLSMETAIDLMVDLAKSIFPSICSVKAALNSLIFGSTGSAILDCLVAGLTNDLVNKFGQTIQNLLPCFVNPLDYVSMVQDTLDKIGGITSLFSQLLRDLINLQSEINQLSTLSLEAPFKDATTHDCNSIALSLLVNLTKSSLGI